MFHHGEGPAARSLEDAEMMTQDRSLPRHVYILRPFCPGGEVPTLASTVGQQVCRRGRLSDDHVRMGSREIPHIM